MGYQKVRKIDKKIKIKNCFPQCFGTEQKSLHKLFINQLQKVYTYTFTYTHKTTTLLYDCYKYITLILHIK